MLDPAEVLRFRLPILVPSPRARSGFAKNGRPHQPRAAKKCKTVNFHFPQHLLTSQFGGESSHDVSVQVQGE